MNIEKRLTGGHPNSLGDTISVVEDVLAEPKLFEELFNCYFSEDEVVRLRVSNAMKRICKAQEQLLLPYLDRLLNEISKINQASTQWTLAQLFKSLEKHLSEDQKKRSIEIMKYNLENHTDWIVLAQTMDTLSAWAKKDALLKDWILPHLQRISEDKRKAVSKKAKKSLEMLSELP
ncbi:MAG: hypothetical protein MRY83_23375 [Flavobacteriales bacterium]|nr:hypothetical protein [Flavobacteriales bacterium]